ncbi:hypothetical protein Syun_008484 [Stephania yunnanensis]|uniref:Uncharacterized protein n=1 Tax=Stephania yunnanensis TaxID=152371 RepID=A0AAP0PQ16_9MAGN
MDEFIMETLEEQSLEAQLMDTTLTEALTENLIEREVEAIQHRVAVGLPPIGSTDIENGDVFMQHGSYFVLMIGSSMIALCVNNDGGIQWHLRFCA